jgi:hypothetical protein
MSTIAEPARELEVIEEGEVAVAGGGPGGVAAASLPFLPEEPTISPEGSAYSSR